MIRIRAISLWEPWATAMAWALKSYETRGWRPSRLPYGTLLAIHAAQRRPTRADLAIAESVGLTAKDLRPGHILSVHRLDRILTTEEVEPRIDDIERHLGNYEAGRYAWHCPLIHRLDQPIAALGKQGFFWVQVPYFAVSPNCDTLASESRHHNAHPINHVPAKKEAP